MDEKVHAENQGSAGIWGWLEYSQIHIGLIAVVMSAASYTLLKVDVNFFVVILGACGAIVIYVLDRLVLDEADRVNHPGRTDWFEGNRSVMLWSIRLLAISCVPLAWLLNTEQKLVAIGLALIGLTYVVPPRPLRSLVWLKPFVISGAWVGGVVLLPGSEAGTELVAVVLLLCYRFVYLLPNTFISDVLDAQGDQEVGYETVATNLSVNQLRTRVLICLVAALGIAVLSVAFSAITLIVLVDWLGMLVYFRFTSTRHSSEKEKFLLDCALMWPLVLFFV